VGARLCRTCNEKIIFFSIKTNSIQFLFCHSIDSTIAGMGGGVSHMEVSLGSESQHKNVGKRRNV
jgi:hypothetical protein